jgi:hypothetical protein
MQAINVHDEDPKREGYSQEGRTAARQSAIHFIFGDAPPTEAIDDFFAMFYHRMALVRPDLKRVGIAVVSFKGNRSWIVVDTKSGLAAGGKEFTDPACYPAAGQKNVPRAFANIESPNPIPAEGKNNQAGFPITLMFPERTRVKDARAVLEDSDQQEVAAWLSTPKNRRGR